MEKKTTTIELSIYTTCAMSFFKPLTIEILDAKTMDTIIREIDFWTNDDNEKSSVCHVGVYVKFLNGSVACVSSIQIYEKEVNDFLVSCGLSK